MKTISVAIALFTALAAASCGDDAYRCTNPDGTIANDFLKSKECAAKLGITQTCWCSYWAEDYIEVPEDKVEDFKNCCESSEGFSTREC